VRRVALNEEKPGFRCVANAVRISFWRVICEWKWSALAACRWNSLLYRMLIKKNRDLKTFCAVTFVPSSENPSR
jgi:hypothetical protein